EEKQTLPATHSVTHVLLFVTFIKTAKTRICVVFPGQCQCQAGWRENDHKCYYFSADTKTWWEANTFYCVARGANLVSIHSQEEEAFLSLYSKGSSKWIGLRNNPTEGGYSWSDGSALSHTHWGPGEPNNHEGREECVEMVSSTNGTYSWWNDLNCDPDSSSTCSACEATS
uniref:C-type lectin domain-containing protein n=1 Tax=Hippocampus comes TaxID=109280 RepID=A0A3Q3DNJ2_HIPCM